MFDRITYKETARMQLRGRWAFPVVMTLIVLVLLSLIKTLNHLGGARTETVAAGSWYIVYRGSALAISLIGVAMAGILRLAQTHVYLRLARTDGKATFDDFLHGLSFWLSGALGGLWFVLWTFLWSLLFVIPGIVKAIAYSQMPFVLAEYPDIGVRKAMHISKLLTRGHKGDLFVMRLSFLGWAILCALSCGIGTLWLAPYMNTSFLNAYFALKNMAIATNVLSPADFAPREDKTI